MYIITKKKDYYDGVVGTTGVDKTIVYNRETSYFDNWPDYPKEFSPNRPYNTRYHNHFLNMSHYTMLRNKGNKYEGNSSFFVGFCGKIYVGWKLYRSENPKMGTSSPMITEITYDYELIKKHISPASWGSNMHDDMEYIASYDAMDMFRSLKVPIFIYDSDYNRTTIDIQRHRAKEMFIINPNLSEYEFYTVMNSFAAFQEIQMFLGGVLGAGEKEITVIEDKYKITQHGFDKFSFRKDKSDGKNERMLNANGEPMGLMESIHTHPIKESSSLDKSYPKPNTDVIYCGIEFAEKLRALLKDV